MNRADRPRPAIAEMARVLDRPPDAGPARYPGDVRVTRRWSHGEIHEALRPMREHVLIAYHGAPREMSRVDGRERRTAVARPGTVTIIPAGHAARWDIGGSLFVSHAYLPATRLPRASGELVGRLAVEDATLARLLALVADESQATDAPARLMVEQALELVTMQLARRHAANPVSQSTPPRGGLSARQLRTVTEAMHARLPEPLTLDELAALAGLSRCHFCTAFQRSTGLAPHQWLRAMRMKEARRLLLDTPLPVIEVAASVGYETPSAFARAFKAAEGMSPLELRRRA